MEYLDEINGYLVKANDLIKNIFFTLVPLYKEQFGKRQDVTVPLFTTLHSTSESILILLLNYGIFEADILLRTVFEGTIKYCYLMTGTEEERDEKYFEYKIKLSDIDRMTDHHKAIETINILKEFSVNSTKPFECSILEADELDKLQKLYPKNVKNDLKRKWSYQSLLRNLAECDEEYKAQLGTLSTYSLSSHFCHYDWTAVSIRQAQIEDSVLDGAEIWDIAHAIRIISNLLSMEVIRVIEYMRGNKYRSLKTSDLISEVMVFTNQLIEKENSIIETNA